MKSVHHPLVVAAVCVACWVLPSCTGPNVIVDPVYVGPDPLTGEPAVSTAVSVEVVDQRRFRGELRADGREVIAEGDKGSVVLDTPAVAYFERHLAQAYAAAGFEVRPDAALTVRVVLRETRFESLGLTHWGLPTERASTLDLATALLPGPARDTRALTVTDVQLLKHGEALGLSYYVEGYAREANPEREPAMVAQVIGRSWSDAVNRAVTGTAGGLRLLENRPATQAEQAAGGGEIDAQRVELDAARADLTRREGQLAADHAAMQTLRAELEGQRAALARDLQERSHEAERLREAAEQLRLDAANAQQRQAQEDQVAATRSEDEAELTQRRLAVLQEAGALKEQRDDVARQAERLQAQLAELTEQRQLVAQRGAELDQQDATLRQRRDELVAWKTSLNEWKERLVLAREEVLAREAAFREREAQILVGEQELAVKREQLAALRRQRAALDPREAAPVVAGVQATPPIVYVARPDNVAPTTQEQVRVAGHVFDDVQVTRTEFSVNGREIRPGDQKGVALTSAGLRSSSSGASKGFTEFAFTVPLEPGPNRVRIEAWDDRGESDFAEFEIERRVEEGLVHLVSIGINAYDTQQTGVPELRYAVDDARAVTEAFARNLGVTGLNIQLYDQDATRANIIQALRRTLPGNVAKQDTVVVFFSGHGAPETLAGGTGDGVAENLVRYLLPVEAQADNLIGSAIPMRDIASHFRRLPCDRLIFIADTCYSGVFAQGGKTVARSSERMKGVALTTVQVVERNAGTGRVFITASKDNEIAHENEDLGHGVFTYHLVAGLDGAADSNADGDVTVRELYGYVSEQTALTTEGRQHPQINDAELQGEVVVGRKR